MPTSAAPVLVILLAGALVFTTGACGGGGGGDSSNGSPELFSGNYFLVGFSGERASTDVGTGFWGSITSDGAGAVVGGTIGRNDNSVVSGPGPITPFDYRVGTDGRMAWAVTGVDSFEGGVSSDGRTAVVGSRTALLSPQVFLMSRREGTFTTASLAGRYHLAAFFYNSTGAADGSIWGAVDFDGAGMATLDVTTNLGGTITPEAPSVTAYAVATDGAVTYTLSTAPLEGGMLAGGALVLLGGQTTSGGVQIVVALIKAGAGLTTSTLVGTYHAVGLFADGGGMPKWRSTSAVASADGAGSLAIATGVSNADTVVTTSPAEARSYTVAGDGALTVTGGAGLVGGVSSSGRYAAFAGGAGTGDDPELWVLVR